MTNHPPAAGGHAKMRPPVSLLAECFGLRNDGALVWRERPMHHFLKPGNARRINLERTGRLAGCVGKDGYLLVRLSIRGKSWLIPAHQIVWAMTYGEWPSSELDHRNNDRSDNQPSNLRIATRPQNMANMNAHSDNKLGLKGVHLHRQTGKYRAKICHERRIISLGLYETPEDAHAAYLVKSRELNGEFARGESSK